MPVNNPPVSTGGGAEGALIFPSYVAGRYYTTQGLGGLTTSTSTDRTFFTPIYIHDEQDFDRIGVEVTTGTGSTDTRLGIFSNLNYKPDLLVLDAGTVETTSAAEKTITINQTLEPGLYWLASTNGLTAATFRHYSSANVIREAPRTTIFDSAFQSVNTNWIGWEYAGSNYSSWHGSGFPLTSINGLTASVSGTSGAKVVALRAA